MKKTILLFNYYIIVVLSCSTETLRINPDNSGTIEYDSHRKKTATCSAKEGILKKPYFKILLMYLMNTLINTMLIKYTPKSKNYSTYLKRKSAHEKKALLIKNTEQQFLKISKVEDVADLTKTRTVG
jgi:hypothetical protein